MLKFLKLSLILSLVSVFAKTDKIVLTSSNSVMINNTIDQKSTAKAMARILELNKAESDEPIYLVLNSPGGSIYSGLDFIRFAKSSRRKIHTISIFAASMAFQIAQMLGDRLVTDFSTLMSHRAAGGVEGFFPGELNERLSLHQSHSDMMNDFVVKRTNGKQTKESYIKLIQTEYWANAERALRDGFADRKIEAVCDESLNEVSESEETILGLFTIKVSYSNCPLITPPIKVVVPEAVKIKSELLNIDIQKEITNLFYRSK